MVRKCQHDRFGDWVCLLLTRLGEGRSVVEIVEEYPDLSNEQVEAAIAYALSLVAQSPPAAE